MRTFLLLSMLSVAAPGARATDPDPNASRRPRVTVTMPFACEADGTDEAAFSLSITEIEGGVERERVTFEYQGCVRLGLPIIGPYEQRTFASPDGQLMLTVGRMHGAERSSLTLLAKDRISGEPQVAAQLGKVTQEELRSTIVIAGTRVNDFRDGRVYDAVVSISRK